MPVPRVSVVLPVYNSERYVGAAVASVLGQTHGDLELLVFDNASTDGTAEVVRGFRDGRVRLALRSENVGPIPNHVAAVRAAGGTYFKIMHGDDVLAPDAVAEQCRALEADPSAGMASCHSLIVDPDGRAVTEARHLAGAVPGREAIAVALTNLSNCLGEPPCALVRTAVVREHRIDYDARYRYVIDLKFHFDVLRHSNYVGLDRVGVHYRRHAESDTVQGCTRAVRWTDWCRLLDEFGGRGPLNLLRLSRLAPSRAAAGKLVLEYLLRGGLTPARFAEARRRRNCWLKAAPDQVPVPGAARPFGTDEAGGGT